MIGEARVTATGARVLVDCLLAQGVDTAFGVPGESYLAVLDALFDEQARIRMVANRQEGGAAFMAEAWAKLTGRVGICFVTRGPGAANAAIGVHTAQQAGTPMILFVGQVGTDIQERGAFQELDYRSVFGGLAKWAVEVDRADRMAEIVGRAFAVAQSGRPGPVVVALPEDVLVARTEVRAGRRVEIPRPGTDPEVMARLRALLAEARAPVVLAAGRWVGPGRDALRTFAEAHGLPVLADFRWQDALDHDSPCYVGDAGLGKPKAVRDLIANADVILALGSDLGEITTDGYTLISSPEPRQTLIHVHKDAGTLNKVYRAELAVQADPEVVVAELAEARLGSHATQTARLRTAHLAFLETPDQPGALDMGRVVAHLDETLPEDAILTNGAGNFAIWLNKHFRFRGSRRLLAPQSGAMGYGLPAAVAAKIADPEACVVCFTGDGDFQMTVQELGTAMQAKAFPIVLVVNNGTYGTIRMHQERAYPGRVSFTDIENPDFEALARAYGFHAARVTRTEDFPEAFAAARESSTGAVLDLSVAAEGITPHQTLTGLHAGVGA